MRRFGHAVIETYAVRVLSMGCGFVGSVLTARALGPEGRGAFAAALAASMIGVQLTTLGLPAANAYFGSTDPGRTGLLAGNSLVYALAAGGGVGVAGYIAAAAVPGTSFLPPSLAGVSMAWIPCGLAYLLLQQLYFGIGRERIANMVEVGTRALNLAIVVVLWAANIATPQPFLLAALGTAAAGVALMVLVLGNRLAVMPGVSAELLRTSIRYGFRIFAAGFFTSLLFRIDTVLVARIDGAHSAGLFSAANSIADAMLVLPGVVGSLLFPRLSREADARARWAMTKRAAHVMAGVMGAALVLTSLFAERLIVMLFGTPFGAAASIYIGLAPAIAFLSVNSVFSALVAGIGQPVTYIFLAVLVATIDVALQAVLLSTHGLRYSPVSLGVSSAVLLAGTVWIARTRNSM